MHVECCDPEVRLVIWSDSVSPYQWQDTLIEYMHARMNTGIYTSPRVAAIYRGYIDFYGRLTANRP